MITDRATSETATDLPGRCHPACFACGVQNGDGLGLQFAERPDGSVVGSFACDGKYQGYPDRLHGGVIAMMADAAMTHCLFIHGIKVVTGKLNLRFPRPVGVGVAWHWESGGYHLHYGEPIELARGRRIKQQAAAATRHWAATVDAFLHAHPEMWWNWLDKRWTQIIRRNKYNTSIRNLGVHVQDSARDVRHA